MENLNDNVFLFLVENHYFIQFLRPHDLQQLGSCCQTLYPLLFQHKNIIVSRDCNMLSTVKTHDKFGFIEKLVLYFYHPPTTIEWCKIPFSRVRELHIHSCPKDSTTSQEFFQNLIFRFNNLKVFKFMIVGITRHMPDATRNRINQCLTISSLHKLEALHLRFNTNWDRARLPFLCNILQGIFQLRELVLLDPLSEISDEFIHCIKKQNKLQSINVSFYCSSTALLFFQRIGINRNIKNIKLTVLENNSYEVILQALTVCVRLEHFHCLGRHCNLPSGPSPSATIHTLHTIALLFETASIESIQSLLHQMGHPRECTIQSDHFIADNSISNNIRNTALTPSSLKHLKISLELQSLFKNVIRTIQHVHYTAGDQPISLFLDHHENVKKLFIDSDCIIQEFILTRHHLFTPFNMMSMHIHCVLSDHHMDTIMFMLSNQPLLQSLELNITNVKLMTNVCGLSKELSLQVNTLRHLVIQINTYVSVFLRHLPIFTKLETLDLSSNNEQMNINILKVQRYKSLRVLRLKGFVSRNIHHVLRKTLSLQVLDICLEEDHVSADPNVLLNCLYQLKHLQKLTITSNLIMTDSFFNQAVKRFLSQMIDLQQVIFKSSLPYQNVLTHTTLQCLHYSRQNWRNPDMKIYFLQAPCWWVSLLNDRHKRYQQIRRHIRCCTILGLFIVIFIIYGVHVYETSYEICIRL